MKIIQIYKCFCDLQRLRILNLLKDGPLCVCHLMEILGEDQVKISKQLRYMKDMGMLESERFAQWMIYRLAEPDNPLLLENLKCLQDSYAEQTEFHQDLKKRNQLIARIEKETPDCAEAISG